VVSNAAVAMQQQYWCAVVRSAVAHNAGNQLLHSQTTAMTTATDKETLTATDKETLTA
jgi:hypothetical protein